MNLLKKLLPLLLFPVFLFLSAGCQPVAQLYTGNFYKDAKTFSLSVPDQTQVDLETFEMTTSFNYKVTGETLSISGTAALGIHYQLMYGRIRDIDLFLFFLNNEGYVVDGARIFNGVYLDSDRKFPFQQELPIPAGSQAIALGYEAFMLSAGSDGGPDGGNWLYQLPLSSGR